MDKHLEIKSFSRRLGATAIVARLYRKNTARFAGGTQSNIDQYVEKFVKLVPSEVIAAYLALKVYVEPLSDGLGYSISSITWGLFFVLSLFTVGFVWKFSVKGGDSIVYIIKYSAVSVVALLVWMINISGDKMFTNYVPAVGSVLVVLFALSVLLFRGE